jgi:3-methyladenine DNA glycosylase AlkD
MLTSARTTRDYVQRLVGALSQAADPFLVPDMERYMHDQFRFFGLKTPERTRVLRTFLAEEGMPHDVRGTVRALWNQDARECQYVACALLIKAKKTLSMDDVPLIEHLITTKSWWDTVDTIVPNVAGPVVLHTNATRALATQWIESDNFWLQRSAILLQLKYKEHTDESLLFDVVLRRASSKEFFVRKAAGWALRQYAYVQPRHVKSFVEQHRHELSGLTIREALKHEEHR